MFKFPKQLNNPQAFKLFQNFSDIFETSNESNKIIFYLHGGGYKYEMAPYYYDFFERLANASQHKIIVPIYPKIPKATHVEIFDHILKYYLYLVNTGYPAHNIIIMGDSAGATLSLKLALYLAENNYNNPKAIIGISPWLDLATDNPLMAKIQPFDQFLDIKTLQNFAKIYANTTDLKSPLISPLYANLSILKNTHILMGTYDILYCDYQIATEKFPNLNYYTFPKAPHCFALLEHEIDSFNLLLKIIKNN